ncbi:hypothetical protein CLIB1444_03S04764 [[Candida] jaroonii]|uniref:Uncharacterized protein n=1 Tax=[Candida] jaroonii TaxID=467808 RepID=A0ACA9Y5W3_9ASCO|nr:hypothetical protein CLIB1444_03S04764 [[Candida] jaroonii]
MISITGIENLIDQYTSNLNESKDPIITGYEIKKIKHDIIDIKLQLNHFKSNKKYTSINEKLSGLQFIIDQKSHELKKTIKEPTPEVTQEKVESVPIPETKDDYNELRQRLLSSSTVLERTNNSNDYHENLQEDILQDLSNLASDLKNGAIQLSYKLVEDEKLMSKTQENLHSNENFMSIVGTNLNSYVMNKSGGKISFWFLVKTMLSIFVAFLMMIIIIKILPKM